MTILVACIRNHWHHLPHPQLYQLDPTHIVDDALTEKGLWSPSTRYQNSRVVPDVSVLQTLYVVCVR